jgi:23S rRNA (cytidine1920-2'-O)/16S rRNA (cytidine1409-2'-O)-methyltransferase
VDESSPLHFATAQVYAPVAQWIEHNIADVGVGGSSPSRRAGWRVGRTVMQWFRKPSGESPSRFDSCTLRMEKQFVSRGGLKLEAAILNFNSDSSEGGLLPISNLVVLDVGSSTGGFVDSLLQNGASKVYSVDTAYGELAWTLRNDPRVVVMERTNILHLETLPEQVDLITIDASWTKLELILPVVKKFLKPGGKIVALLKPHYQTDQKILKKGVVPEEYLEQIKRMTINKIEALDFKVEREMESPILGGGGNKEYLLQISA